MSSAAVIVVCAWNDARSGGLQASKGVTIAFKDEVEIRYADA